jgi:hypothetical protein
MGSKLIKYSVYGSLILFSPFFFLTLGMYFNWFGVYEGAGENVQEGRSYLISNNEINQSADESVKQILFGDLHVHSTFSLDAFQGNLPIINGEGTHPVSDACNFARFCANLDFFAVTDHAEWLNRREWRDTISSIQDCASISEDLDNPTIIPLLGWEWTQKSIDKSNHYGHKNVILRSIEKDKIPLRPIGAEGKFFEGFLNTPVFRMLTASLYDFKNRQNYFNWRYRHLVTNNLDRCSSDIPVRDLPIDCIERAISPEILFNKLDDWGFDSMVIPHGTTWGNSAPPMAAWDTQLNEKDHNPKYQKLIELYSGHGNTEEYRSWRTLNNDNNGILSCPQPSPGFIPECHQAGEIIRERCRVAAGSLEECDKRARAARKNYVSVNPFGLLTVPGSGPEEWLNSGQCLDCFLPAFNYRPQMSAQYALAIRDFTSGEPEGYRFGFIGSSDNHQSRPGTGYKEVIRTLNSDSKYSSKNKTLLNSLNTLEEPRLPSTKEIDLNKFKNRISIPRKIERISSFLYTGGLVAAHSMGRNRQALWDSMDSREVYATSGDRILLWFDLINHHSGVIQPMGSEVDQDSNPVFRVKALGAQIQKPGCDLDDNKTIDEVISKLCKGECFNPSDQRKLITTIEIVRIRPQSYSGEPIDPLIEDPWKTFNCEPSQEGCLVEFKDEQFLGSNREIVYYARAIQEPSKAINGNGFSCVNDENGLCAAVNLCGEEKGQEAGDCLGEVEERAWSSPIFVKVPKKPF